VLGKKHPGDWAISTEMVVPPIVEAAIPVDQAVDWAVD
jgi:hypothetical protein